MKTTIYAVTDGSYSDYRVCGVYSTRAKADHAVKFFCADNGVDEWTLDAIPDHPEGMLFWNVDMDRDGNTDEVKQENGTYADAYLKDEWRPNGDGSFVCFYMWATDEEHAVKIANERRIALLASGQWTADWNTWKERRHP